MFKPPEFVTLSGNTPSGNLGNTPHQFIWYNQTPVDFERLAAGKRIGKAWAKGKWLFIPLKPGYLLVFDECGRSNSSLALVCDYCPACQLQTIS